MHPKFRYVDRNIIIVCPWYRSLKTCHKDVDKAAAGSKNVIKQLLGRGENITYPLLLELKSLGMDEIKEKFGL